MVYRAAAHGFSARHFRGGAVGLGEAIESPPASGRGFQAVVAVWGNFHERHYEHDKVIYLAGDRARILATTATPTVERTAAKDHRTRHQADR